MLPVYPFLALAGAALFARARWRVRSPATVWLLGALPLLSAVEIARIHPHELSYFNPLAGGPERGRRILSDSNVDWGLDLKRLALEAAHPASAIRPWRISGDDVGFRMECRISWSSLACASARGGLRLLPGEGPQFCATRERRRRRRRWKNCWPRSRRAASPQAASAAIELFQASAARGLVPSRTRDRE